MKNRKTSFRALAMPLALSLGLSCGANNGVSHAQPPEPKPEPGQQRQQQIQQWLQNMTPQQQEQMLQRLQNMTPAQRQQIRQFIQEMTPEQRLQMQQQLQPLLQKMTPPQQKQVQELLQTPVQQREAWVREVTAASGFVAVELQDSIIAFMRAEDEARKPLRTAASTLSESLLNPALTDEQLKNTMNTFRELVAKDQGRYQAQLAVLDEKISYSTQPRLEMLLGVLGVVGQETAYLGGVGALFPDSGFASGLITAEAKN